MTIIIIEIQFPNQIIKIDIQTKTMLKSTYYTYYTSACNNNFNSKSTNNADNGTKKTLYYHIFVTQLKKKIIVNLPTIINYLKYIG